MFRVVGAAMNDSPQFGDAIGAAIPKRSKV